MIACADLEGLLAERASGAVLAADEARLAEHLARCAGCAAAAREYEAVFAAVALPPPRRAPSLAEAVLHAARAQRRRRITGFALGSGFAAAAAGALVVMSPALLTPRAFPGAAPAAAAQAWEPDVDGALELSGYPVAADDGASDEALTAADAALAAFDAAAEP
jgi:hypothetical protein